jgi:hypothetical protein
VSTDAHREEVVNVALADALTQLGALSRAETIVKARGGKQYPDVRTEWTGLKYVLECKFDAPGAAADVSAQVEERLADALGDVGVAILYPQELRRSPKLGADLVDATLKARFFAAGRTWPWIDLRGVRGLLSCLEQAREMLIADDVVTKAADRLDHAIQVFERAVEAQPGRETRLLAIVSAAEAAGSGSAASPKALAAGRAIAGLAVCTAALLQAELSKIDPLVPPPPQSLPEERRRALVRSWQEVLSHGYASVFRVATDVLEVLADDDALASALTLVDSVAADVARQKVLGRHDLIGRIYHTLLADQKFLATYFTSVSAATLLCQLALTREHWPQIDWARDPEEGSPITIGDLACGTGTLLVASLAAVRESWAAARAKNQEPIDSSLFTRGMIENAIWGYDVLAYALQVCASTLLLSAPGTTVAGTRLHLMPFGGRAGRLGSLDLLSGETQAQLWGAAQAAQVGPDAHADLSDVHVPELDFLAMNPPFTRSVGGSQLLGSLEGASFAKARQRLKELVKRPDVAATLTAGLGAPFVELALRCLRTGGRLALVLPKTVLTGEAWAETRKLLATSCHVEYVISSHEADRWNFSDSTKLSEVLLIARRTLPAEHAAERTTTWVALSRNPRTPIEALGHVAAIRRLATPPVAGAPVTVREGLDGDVGEAFSRPAPTSGGAWRHATFSRSVLDAAAEALLDGQPIPLPRLSEPLAIPLSPLGNLGRLGYDRRDITDAFEVVSTTHGYPALWGQDANTVKSMQLKANAELSPRSSPAPGRLRIKDAVAVWGAAGELMIAERCRATTYRCVAGVLDSRALSNTYWSVGLLSGNVEDSRILALWLNSSLGVLSYLGAAEETEGPWVAMKKNKLKTLRVLDPAALSAEQRAGLLKAWTELHAEPLSPISQLRADSTRRRIDAAVAEALGTTEDVLSSLRDLLGSEPRFQPAIPDTPPAAPPAFEQKPLF